MVKKMLHNVNIFKKVIQGRKVAIFYNLDLLLLMLYSRNIGNLFRYNK